MPNKQRWRRLEFCSACRLDEVSSKWHRVANTELDLFICHRVYQANRKDLIKAKAETKDEGSRKAAVAAAPSRAKGTWGGEPPSRAKEGRSRGGAHNMSRPEPKAKASEAHPQASIPGGLLPQRAGVWQWYEREPGGDRGDARVRAEVAMRTAGDRSRGDVFDVFDVSAARYVYIRRCISGPGVSQRATFCAFKRRKINIEQKHGEMLDYG